MIGTDKQNQHYEKVNAESASPQISILEDINNQLTDLNKFASDIDENIWRFNDRVLGCIPRDAIDTEKQPHESLAATIQHKINLLRDTLNEIHTESKRLNDIG